MRRFNAKNSLSLALLAVLLLTLIFGMAISSVQPVTAQRPQRTPAAGGRSVALPTIELSGLQITMPAADDMMATANALLESMSDSDMDALMATANALLTAMPTFTGGLSSDDLSEWLTSLSASAMSFDPDTGAMIVTLTIDEDMVDTVVDTALIAADSGASTVSVDFVDGLVVIRADDVTLSSKLAGDLVVSVALTADDGAIVVTIVTASLNGKALPPATLAELTALLETSFNDSLETPEGLDYAVETLVVTDEGIDVTLSLELSLE